MEEKKIVETLFVRRSVNVSEQDIDDILCTAFEGGIIFVGGESMGAILMLLFLLYVGYRK